jgi:4-amino-4-deoxy-L-arabinose transferase-like glycosyltransferase
MLFLARLPGVLLGVLLGLYAWRWARQAFGEAAGLAALSLVALNPNLIAHAAVASNDFAVVVFGFAACFHAARWLDTGRRGSLLGAAVMLGLAIGCKFTALVLLPVLGLIVLGAALRRRRPALLGEALLALFAAAGVLWLLYGGEARSLTEAASHPRFAAEGVNGRAFENPAFESALRSVFGTQTPIPLLTFLRGIDEQIANASVGHATFWRGVNGLEGSPEFYVGSWLIKNPEAFTLLLLLGLLAWRRTWRGGATEALLLLYPVLILLVFSRGQAQLGFKYVLPVVPFFAVFAARWLDAPPGGSPGCSRRGALAAAALLLLASVAVQLWIGDKGPWRWSHAVPWIAPLVVAGLLVAARPGAGGRVPLALPAGALLLWAALASLLRQPDDLVYFNEWVGGPDNGTTWSVVGDDFGQDTGLLGAWMAQHGVERLRYDYYGTGDPEAWGVRSTPCYGHPPTYEPFTGLCAVHVTQLRRMPEAYDFLLGKEPFERLGHTIFLYDLTQEDADAAVARLARRPPAREPEPHQDEGR